MGWVPVGQPVYAQVAEPSKAAYAALRWELIKLTSYQQIENKCVPARGEGGETLVNAGAKAKGKAKAKAASTTKSGKGRKQRAKNWRLRPKGKALQRETRDSTRRYPQECGIRDVILLLLFNCAWEGH